MENRQRSPVKPGWDAQTAVQEVNEATPLFSELTSTYEVSFRHPKMIFFVS